MNNIVSLILIYFSTEKISTHLICHAWRYLYLLKKDYEKLPAGSVQARKVLGEQGEERYVLEAIIGEGMKSTEGGIGVENLQGSGLIAGETSRAYQARA